MMALLAGIGIEKGQEFKPDAETQKALLEGLQRAYDWMQDYFVNRSTVPWWNNRQWQVWQFAEGQPQAGFPYVTADRVLTDERAGGAYEHKMEATVRGTYRTRMIKPISRSRKGGGRS